MTRRAVWTYFTATSNFCKNISCSFNAAFLNISSSLCSGLAPARSFYVFRLLVQDRRIIVFRAVLVVAVGRAEEPDKQDEAAEEGNQADELPPARFADVVEAAGV